MVFESGFSVVFRGFTVVFRWFFGGFTKNHKPLGNGKWFLPSLPKTLGRQIFLIERVDGKILHSMVCFECHTTIFL